MGRYVVSGTIKGYADEVDAVLQQVEKMLALVRGKSPGSGCKLVRTDFLSLGTRGFFNKRAVVQIRYDIFMDFPEQLPPIRRFFESLVDRMS